MYTSVITHLYTPNFNDEKKCKIAKLKLFPQVPLGTIYVIKGTDT